MVVYFQERVQSSQAGLRVVAVRCDKCYCEFFFELARVGSGAGVAVYGIGSSTAASDADKRAKRDLVDRLAFEAELVPCPKCNWINDELVNGYRKGRYRNAVGLAAGIAFFGTVASLIGAWFIYKGSPQDRAALPYFLFVGPIVFLSLGGLVIVFRNWLRARIQPNFNFPMLPRLPAGTPPALLEDPNTGELRPQAVWQATAVKSTWHEFQIGRNAFPLVCCECQEGVQSGHAFTVPAANAMNLNIPHCETCAANVKRSRRMISLGVASASLLAGSAIVWLLRLQDEEFWVFFVVIAFVAFGLGQYVASSMTAPVKVRISDASRGIVQLRFKNASYMPRNL